MNYFLPSCIEEHGIGEKVDYVVPDNGSNMVAALRKMNEKIDQDVEGEGVNVENEEWEDVEE